MNAMHCSQIVKITRIARKYFASLELNYFRVKDQFAKDEPLQIRVNNI